MSRCFPFPPPGYVKKARLGDAELLTKEKHGEKRHKKDKKDKEKREGKERKRDKERNNGSHKEKKDRKEKHKDRKDKDRDKEKKSTLVEKTITGPLDGQNGKNLVSSKCLQSGDTTETRFLLELGKRIKKDGEARVNQMFQSITVTYKRSGELQGRVVEINFGNSTEGKEKYNNKRDDDRNDNGITDKIEPKGVENAFFHDRGHEKKSRAKDKDRFKEKEREAKAKEKEPNKELSMFSESSKDGIASHGIKPSYLLKDDNRSSPCKLNLGKRKGLEINGFLYDDFIRPNKLPRLISSSEQLVENGRKLEQCQNTLQVVCDRKQAVANTHKVEESEVSFCRQTLQNGRKLHPNLIAIRRQEPSNSSVIRKDGKINGLVEAQQLDACSSKPLSNSRQGKEKVEASKKLLHPDSKYLCQILSVPKVVEWSDFDDQEWLFSSYNLHLEKPKPGSFEFGGIPRAWAEASRIESMDVTALPYVVPF
ncbi:hypothetical protein U1Q18_033780 [Sarracenia purpurea var. burkii]